MELRGVKSVRSFGKQDNKKLGNLLIIACTVLCLFLLALVKAHYCPAPYVKSESQAALKLQLPKETDLKMVTDVSVDDSSLQEDEDEDEGQTPTPTNTKPVCYDSGSRSDTCEAEGDIRVQAISKTIFMSNPPTNQEWKIKPYARQGDTNGALAHVQEWSLKPFPSINQQPLPRCTDNHTSPAVIFSTGGFTGNLFHDFTDVLVPLFITSHQFNKQVHFLVSDTKTWWLGRFRKILNELTGHEIVDLESTVEKEKIRCYPRVIIGPTFHKELAVEPTKSPTSSILDFKKLLRHGFGLKRTSAERGSTNSLERGGVRRPRLLIICRKRSRAFLNIRGIESMATSLGFDVRVSEPNFSTDVGKFARLVNSADVMLGVHGAGLTNMVYLPEGAVLIQVIPFGGLEWVARSSFKDAAIGMGLKYLEYGIKEEESSLIEQYPRDHPVIKDPASIRNKGWNALKEVYLDKQSVRPHLGRLRDTLLEAVKLLPKGR